MWAAVIRSACTTCATDTRIDVGPLPNQVTVGFVLLSHMLFRVTMELRFLLVPDDTGVAVRVCVAVLAYLVALVSCGAVLSGLGVHPAAVIALGVALGVASIVMYRAFHPRIVGESLAHRCGFARPHVSCCCVAVGFTAVWLGVVGSSVFHAAHDGEVHPSAGNSHPWRWRWRRGIARCDQRQWR